MLNEHTSLTSNIFELVSKLCLTNTETRTPDSLVNKILDKLPVEIWHNPDLTFLDPCVGTGTFYICLLERLIVGLTEKIPDRNKRIQHILLNQLYAADSNHRQIRIFNATLKKLGFENFKKNVYNRDSLKYNYNMKFDVIVGNPPYNEASESENFNTKQKGSANFWIEFFKFAKLHLKDNGVIAFITPNHWFRKSNRISKVFKSGQFIWAEIGQDVSKMFGVGSTITAWIWSPKPGDHNVLLDGVKINNIFDRLQPLTKGATFDDWTFLNETSNNGRIPVKWERTSNCLQMQVPCIVVERASPMKGSYLWDGVSRPKGDWYFYNTTKPIADNIIQFLKGNDGQRMLNLGRSGMAMTHVINELPVFQSQDDE